MTASWKDVRYFVPNEICREIVEMDVVFPTGTKNRFWAARVVYDGTERNAECFEAFWVYRNEHGSFEREPCAA